MLRKKINEDYFAKELPENFDRAETDLKHEYNIDNKNKSVV
jgi:hypothetical protein